MLVSCLSLGVEYIFVSNIDNLGATVDTSLLKHVIDSDAEFVMEVTDKTRADIKGGTLVSVDGQIRLLELAQVTSDHRADFMKRFKVDECFECRFLIRTTCGSARVPSSGFSASAPWSSKSSSIPSRFVYSIH